MENLLALFYHYQDSLIARYNYDRFTFYANCGLIGVSLFGIFIAYWLIIYHRIKEHLSGKGRAVIVSALNELFIETVLDAPAENFESEIPASIIAFRKKHLGSKFGREIVISELMQLHKNFTGTTAENIRKLYFQPELDKASIKKLKWGTWSRKAMAIRELSRFGVADTIEMVARYVNNRNEILRLEAQVGYLKLHNEHPFDFLENLQGPMSEWHQLNLFNTVTQLDRLKIPSFSKWFASFNDSVVLFAIKMATHFNQLDAADSLITLFDHRSLEIKAESIKAFGVLQASQSVRDLLVFYEEANGSEKQLILATLGKISADEAIEFISKEVRNKDYDIALAAARALKEYYTGRTLLIQIKEQSNERVGAIIAHALDDRI